MIFNAVFCDYHQEVDFSNSSLDFFQFEASGWVEALCVVLPRAKELGKLLDSLDVEDYDDSTGFDLP